MDIKLENPKDFLQLLLFFGGVLVLMGALTANPSVANPGWIVVGISVILWILSNLSGSHKGSK